MSKLQVGDPFLTKRSKEVCEFLKSEAEVGCAFSVDIVDLFYSVPHAALFTAVRECIERNEPVSFQNSAGISIDDFLTVLKFYLESTFITFDQRYFLQNAGICIRSCIAPVLCNIFLSQMDQVLHQVLPSNDVLKFLDMWMIF